VASGFERPLISVTKSRSFLDFIIAER